MAKKLWNNENYVQKRKNKRSGKEFREIKNRIMKKLFEAPIFKQKHKDRQLRCRDHPGWNPNRNEIMQPYGPEWYEPKKE